MGGGILVNLKKISILDTQANYKLEGDTPKEMKMQADVILTVAESKRLILRESLRYYLYRRQHKTV